ncbi:hypothetical protein BDV25DRAFT_171213 [Aspergillus avenaceus]|uniref:Extracellular protein n=1 Tax=Aspergillus avenaceus TaxID=36643 RepID=A0A5N6TZJ1_ASPAV|nr:hypothetical protein BDV25DRAFT_171213 [Aspergillus avenaceus]
MKTLALLCSLLAASASAHMQMSKPYPIRSPLNKDASGKKDYSYTNPLSTSGSDYPCKGYADDDFKSVATYEQGQEYDLELQGSATHDGGSCQIALSYDKGKTFRAIHSMLGGCPLTKKYKFEIPSEAPNGEALLAWTWFNKIGNREMYMNCAQVTIGGSENRTQNKTLVRRGGFDDLPEIFQANNNGPGGCTTVEGEEVNFPKPGPSKEGDLSGKGYKCTGSAPFLGDSKSPKLNSTLNANSTTHGSKSSALYSSSATPSSNRASSLFGRPSSSRAASSTPASSTPASPTPTPHSRHQPGRFLSRPGSRPGSRPLRVHGPNDHQPCTDGQIICAPDGHSWSLCDHGSPVFMGSVADGMRCRHGSMHRAAW